MAFSGAPLGVLSPPAPPLVDDVLDAIFRPPVARQPVTRPKQPAPPTAEAQLNVLASGLGLTAGPGPSAAAPPVGKSAAAKAALLSLGLHLRR